jgi:hypothetical protein
MGPEVGNMQMQEQTNYPFNDKRLLSADKTEYQLQLNKLDT